MGAGGQGASVFGCSAQAKIQNLPSAAAFPPVHVWDRRSTLGAVEREQCCCCCLPQKARSELSVLPWHRDGHAVLPWHRHQHITAGPQGRAVPLQAPLLPRSAPGVGAAARIDTGGLHGRIKQRFPIQPRGRALCPSRPRSAPPAPGGGRKPRWAAAEPLPEWRRRGAARMGRWRAEGCGGQRRARRSSPL